MSTQRAQGVSLKQHLEATRVADLRDVFSFWKGDEAPKATKKELVGTLQDLMQEEGTVYRRVRTLTRRVLDVLLLLLRRDHYASDLPGLFQRLPGEEAVRMEFHEAEAGIKALRRRGFLAELGDKGMNSNGRVVYSVPDELGRMLTSLFREETRTVESVFSFAGHAATITATERDRLRGTFPSLSARPAPDDAEQLLGEGGAPALIASLPTEFQEMVDYAIKRHGGVMSRAQWSERKRLRSLRWDRERWTEALESKGVGTVARLSLNTYGLACDDEVLVIFDEVLADLAARETVEAPSFERVLKPSCDYVTDLAYFLEYVRRNPLKVKNTGEVYKAGRKKVMGGFVFETGPVIDLDHVWKRIYHAVNHLGMVTKDDEGFLELRPEAEAWLAEPLEEKVRALLRTAMELPGPKGRSLHQHELRTVVTELLREKPTRWWRDQLLARAARHRYCVSLDDRDIKNRHRDRYFSAYFSGQETLADLADDLAADWMPELYMLGLLEVGLDEKERACAWRLTALGARVLGAELSHLDTGLRPLLVNPDFEILVLPEGDVTDVIHTLDMWAQRTKNGEVVHFRLTREAMERAVGAGRSAKELTDFLVARARGDVPQNILYSLDSWAGSVTFAQAERGVLLSAESEDALDRILAFPEMEALLARRLAPSLAFLKEAPEDRKLLAALRERGIELQIH